MYLDSIPLKTKLYTLLALMVAALGTITIISFGNMKEMKKSLDTIYFGNFIPVVKLKEMLYLYSNNITLTLYLAKNSQISFQKSAKNLSSAKQEILKKWQAYKSIYKSKEELDYLNYANAQIITTDELISKLIEIYKSEDTKMIKQISLKSIKKSIEKTKNIIYKIIEYEIKVAQKERKSVLANYKLAVRNMYIVLGVIFLLAFGISVPIIKNITSNQKKLESTTKKLELANKELKNFSITDPLTSVFNRRYFEEIFPKEIARAKRDRKSLTFMMLDIDFFKQYNDTYGHQKGDEALKSVAKTIKNTLKRPSDYVFRLGGEEFGMLLSGVNEKNSLMLAEKIIKSIKELKIEHKKNQACSFVTVSIGLCVVLTDKPISKEDMMAKADENLYKAKNSGRNRAII